MNTQNHFGNVAAPARSMSPTVKSGTMSIFRSSASLPWQGFVLERRVFFPETCLGNSIDRHERHVIAMLCSSVSRGERLDLAGKFVPYMKTSGAITVLPKGPAPHSRLLTSSDQLYCSFEEEFIDSVAGEMDDRLPLQPRCRVLMQDWHTSQLLSLLLTELEAGAPSGTFYAESLALALASRFLMLATDVSKTWPSEPSAFPPGRLARVKEFINVHLDHDLSLSALAAASGYSRTHFLRIFRAATGMTPHKYVMEERIVRAQRLLAKQTLSVADIAVSCGFSSQAHMTLLFRKRLGTTPAEYRRRQ